METMKLKVNGMSCMMCVKHVTHALQGVDGVTDVAVSLDAGGTATVTFDPAKANLASFTAAVAEADYEVAGLA
ncbi:MAG: heavy-metal-associated domain-containing protein [Anaerolineae bacterium]|nr:heavy-metal-associated domain-containing protein [Anaerolineae bacterium]